MKRVHEMRRGKSSNELIELVVVIDCKYNPSVYLVVTSSSWAFPLSHPALKNSIITPDVASCT